MFVRGCFPPPCLVRGTSKKGTLWAFWPTLSGTNQKTNQNNGHVEKNGEIVLINSHIASYKQASYSNHSPSDERKLLLNKREINKLIGKTQREGFTLVPTKMYFKKGKAKIELAVAKGKKQFDKRSVKKDRDWSRTKARYIRKSS